MSLVSLQQGIHLIAIGVGASTGPRELAGIATDPDSDNVFDVNSFDALSGILDSLLEKACNSE